MPTILLTLDDSDASHHAALVASTLFGESATYVAVHVQPGVDASGALWPAYGYPYPAVPPNALSDAASRRTAIQDARATAAALAREAGVEATAIGEAGRPAEAIVRAAAEHSADVIVVGDHERSWLRAWLEGDVADRLVDMSSLPVLVVPLAEDEA